MTSTQSSVSGGCKFCRLQRPSLKRSCEPMTERKLQQASAQLAASLAAVKQAEQKVTNERHVSKSIANKPGPKVSVANQTSDAFACRGRGFRAERPLPPPTLSLSSLSRGPRLFYGYMFIRKTPTWRNLSPRS